MQPKSEPPLVQSKHYTIFFMVALSLICAVILSSLASVLKDPQELAKELDRSKQMLIAARILNPAGYLQIEDKGAFKPAKLVDGKLIEAGSPIFPSREEILKIYRARIEPFLVDENGKETTFQKAGLNEPEYTKAFRKTGYYKEKLKLVYKILDNPVDEKTPTKIIGYVFPINGMGLWDAIYGYLALKTDGDSVIGISWYDQKETPGLGANIAEPEWQSQFPGKKVFLSSPNAKTDYETAPLGITVVKGKVAEVLGDSPKASTAVDGMAGATLTGNGVTSAYRDVLAAYRPFLVSLQKPTNTL